MFSLRPCNSLNRLGQFEVHVSGSGLEVELQSWAEEGGGNARWSQDDAISPLVGLNEHVISSCPDTHAGIHSHILKDTHATMHAMHTQAISLPRLFLFSSNTDARILFIKQRFFSSVSLILGESLFNYEKKKSYACSIILFAENPVIFRIFPQNPCTTGKK